MRRRALGAGRLTVSELGLGTWQTFENGRDDGLARGLVDAALALGITLFDTADSYGDGAAERALGRALRSAPRSGFVVATKCSSPTSVGCGLSRAHVLRSARRSLENLGLEAIDLLQCHRFDPSVPLEETCGAMGELIAAGMVRHWGLGRFSPEQTRATLEAALRVGTPAPISNQVPYHLFERALERQGAGVGFITYSPLAQGVLTGKYLRRAVPADSRAASEARSGMWELKPDNEVRVERVVALAARAGRSPAGLAIAFCLRRPEVAAVLLGARTPEQLVDNVRSAEALLTEGLVEALEGV